MIPLLALGYHLFEILPFSLQRLEEETTANWPVVERFGAGPARQFTGPGDATLKIEGLLFNEEFGGYPEYLALKASQQRGQPLDLVGWGGGGAFAMILGPVCILKVSATHEMIGRDGIGRKIAFTVEVAKWGGGPPGGFF
jgi:phage protein U